MTSQTVNPVLDRLMRHMAWANQQVLSILSTLPEDALESHAANEPEWTVRAITRHMVNSAGFYGTRLGAQVQLLPYDQPEVPETMAELAAAVAGFDSVLREQAQLPDGPTTFTRADGVVVTRARSTILGQSIHHCIEHRAQVAGILSAHGIPVIDLDEFDVWALGDAEGRGE